MPSHSSTDSVVAMKEAYGRILPNYDWDTAEINDDGLPCCKVCHEPLIDFWQDLPLFHECPAVSKSFLRDLGMPYHRMCLCERQRANEPQSDKSVLEEKRRHLLEEAGLPKAVASINFDRLDYGLNSNWTGLVPLLETLVSEWTRDARKGAMLVGPSGAGKTMMMVAIAAEFIGKHLAPVRFYTECGLLDGMRNRRPQTVAALTSADVILVDDLGTALYRSGDRNLATQRELRDALTEIDGAGTTLITASSFTPDELVYDCGIWGDTILKLKRLCPQGFRILPDVKPSKESPRPMEK